MLEVRLYLAQRASAAIMAPLVLIHLGVMIYAIQGGIDAAEILERTRGSLFWGVNYGLFVVAVSVHASIGLRNILREWLAVRGTSLSLISWIFFAGLLTAGLRAVAAVVIA
ncbi:MAG: succinate dehydrogenase [Gammaproteobacteria bacterium]|jgi:fumarate reductase subunit C|nr:succinate dehydrogenase [Gammaproteobacteria bacterium]